MFLAALKPHTLCLISIFEEIRNAWIRIVILICTLAQLYLLHKVICRLHVSTNK